VSVHLGVRHWDHVAPLALGDVALPTGLDLRVTRLETTPDLWSDDGYDLAETSFSRYVRARAAGDERVVALPVFVMRAFRQRCVIVRADAEAFEPGHLRGARIGLTGWPDSGNTWTRALLREDDVEVADARWVVGPLTDRHPGDVDRLGGPVPDTVRAARDGEDLVGMLRAGELDAVMTPFMPPGFHHRDSGLRPLYPDTRAAERGYFARHGFVPGIHLVGVRAALLAERPELGQQLVDAFQDAKRLAFARRSKLVDVTPWHNEAVAETSRVFGPDWLPYGTAADRAMTAAFTAELVAQRLLDGPVGHDVLFPVPLEPTDPVESADPAPPAPHRQEIPA